MLSDFSTIFLLITMTSFTDRQQIFDFFINVRLVKITDNLSENGLVETQPELCGPFTDVTLTVTRSYWSGYTYDAFTPIVIGDGQVLPDLVKNGQPFYSIKKAIG